jgi:hypothetical protein
VIHIAKTKQKTKQNKAKKKEKKKLFLLYDKNNVRNQLVL